MIKKHSNDDTIGENNDTKNNNNNDYGNQKITNIRILTTRTNNDNRYYILLRSKIIFPQFLTGLVHNKGSRVVKPFVMHKNMSKSCRAE